MATKPRPTRSMREWVPVSLVDQTRTDYISLSGCEPLTPDDIAEVVVFTASRRQNVVIADTLVFPNHQVGVRPFPPTCNTTSSHTRG